MPQWTTGPPNKPDGYTLRILRTPAEKPITAIVTTTDVLGCNTHYVNHRTQPCEGSETCPFCAEGHSWRWHGYLAAMLTDSLEHILFEFTATASLTFANYQQLHTTMRGCLFKATRPSRRSNGRVVIQARPADEQRTRLPEPPDVKAVLCHIWNIQNRLATERHIPDRLGNIISVERGNGKHTPKPAI